MTELSNRNFGLLIAYLIPGLTVIWAMGSFSPTVQTWLSVAPEQSPTVAGFLYLTVVSTAAGVTVSAIRWATIERIHALTGVSPPEWNFSEYPAKVSAFDSIVEDHYRYYQFYANMFVAAAIWYAARCVSDPIFVANALWLHVSFVFLEVIFFAGSRDALKKYYARGSHLLSTSRRAGRTIKHKQNTSDNGDPSLQARRVAETH